MASPPPAPRSTRSRPSIPPTANASLSSSRSTPALSHSNLLPLPTDTASEGGSPQSANALAHALYTQSLQGLGGGRRRKKSTGTVGGEPMDVDSLKEDDPEPNGDTVAGLKGEVEEEVDVELEDAGANADPDEDDKDRVRSKKMTKEAKDDPEDGGGDEDDDESSAEEAEITRCPCGITESDDMMIQCDTCNVWQHGACVGIPTEEETPDEYYCEKCRPDLHLTLKKWTRSRGRGGIFLPPSPADLARLKDKDDPNPPNQSKRWTHDLPGLAKEEEIWEDADVNGVDKRGRRSRHSGGLPVLKGKAERSVSAAAAAAAQQATSTSSSSNATPSGAGPSSHPGVAGANTSTAVGSVAQPPSTGPKSHHRKPSLTSSTVSGKSKSAPRPPSSSRTSPSPPPTDKAAGSGSSKKRNKSPVKRRSTLNSRVYGDAALEEAIRASLMEAGQLPEDEGRESDEEDEDGGEGSDGEKDDRAKRKGKKATSAKSESVSGDAGPAGSTSQVAGQKRGRTTSDGTFSRKGKKAKKETLAPIPDDLDPSAASDSATAAQSLNSKHLKHPNQYTYRPKPSGAGGPSNGAGSSSLQVNQPSPSKPTKEGRKSAGGRSGTPAGGELPMSGGGSSGKNNPWSLPDHLSHLTSLLPTPVPVPLKVPSVSVSSEGVRRDTKDEMPTKVRWPGRRMTIGEMRKRVRGILDFVGRWPVDEDVAEDKEGEGAGGDVDMAEENGAQSSGKKDKGKSRADQVEELIRDLIGFEQRFGVTAQVAAAATPTTATTPAAASLKSDVPPSPGLNVESSSTPIEPPTAESISVVEEIAATTESATAHEDVDMDVPAEEKVEGGVVEPAVDLPPSEALPLPDVNPPVSDTSESRGPLLDEPASDIVDAFAELEPLNADNSYPTEASAVDLPPASPASLTGLGLDTLLPSPPPAEDSLAALPPVDSALVDRSEPTSGEVVVELSTQQPSKILLSADAPQAVLPEVPPSSDVEDKALVPRPALVENGGEPMEGVNDVAVALLPEAAAESLPSLS